MRDKERVIVDTSIWIEYFNHPDSLFGEELKNLLEKECVVTTGVIMAELLQGAKTEREFEDLKISFNYLPFLREDIDIWEKVGELSFELRKRGKTIPLTDCLIATFGKEKNIPIFTLDPHFKVIEGIRLYESIY